MLQQINLKWDDRYQRPEWDDAYRRTEAYLAALQIRNKLLVSKLVNEVLEITAKRCETSPEIAPEVEACRIIDEMVDRWFERSIKSHFPDLDFPPAAIRLALLSNENPLEWQRYFLLDAELPTNLVQRFKEQLVNAGPEFRLSTLRARPVDFGRFNQMTESALVGLDNRPKLRMAIVSCGTLFFFGTLFYMTR